MKTFFRQETNLQIKYTAPEATNSFFKSADDPVASCVNPDCVTEPMESNRPDGVNAAFTPPTLAIAIAAASGANARDGACGAGEGVSAILGW